MATELPRKSTGLRAIWHAFREHFRPTVRRIRVTDAASLGEFIDSRSSYVAQASLYGYLRTRAGSRYPDLFSRPDFIADMNIAKWHLWLACVSDLAVYAGGLLRRRTTSSAADTGKLIGSVVAAVLANAAASDEAGEAFAQHAERVRARIALCGWDGLAEGGAPFTESPAALVRWAPVVDELKALDEDIVRNSIRFRWQEVRRELQQALDADALTGGGTSSGPE